MAGFKGTDGKNYSWVDADTFTDGDTRYRIDGYNAPEESKVVQDEDKGLRFKQGQVGGTETTRAVERITNTGGFNIVEPTGKTDSFGRQRVRLKNEDGMDLTTTLYEAGVISANEFTDAADYEAMIAGEAMQEISGKRLYDNIVTEELSEIQNRPVTFKETALNEREYLQGVIGTIAAQQGLDLNDPEDYSKALNLAGDGVYDMRSLPFAGVEFRSSDRTLDNFAYNQMGAAWNQGWRGMGTGLAGFAELIGVGLGSETIELWGAEKVDEAKQALLDAPQLRNLNYTDVDDVWDAFGYLSNNVAMSAPYLITLTAGTLAAPVTGGVSAKIAYGSVGASYAGQVWNDIQGPKGREEAAGALLTGVAMASLDRLGLAGFAGIKPSMMLNKQGRLEVAKALKAKNPGMTSKEALAEVTKVSKKEMKELVTGMGNFATDNFKDSTILRNVLRGSGQGAISEGITELGQEGLGYTSAAAMSEGGLKENFNPNEFTNLITNAAIAGTTLGAGFSGAGQVVREGGDFAFRRGLERGDIDKLSERDRLGMELGRLGSVEGIINDLNNKTRKKQPNNTVTNPFGKERTDKIKKDSKGTIWDRIKAAPSKLPNLFRASVNTVFSPEILRRSEIAAKMYGLIGQVGGRLYSGRDVQAREAEVRSKMLDLINNKRILKRFGLKDRRESSQKISDLIRKAAPFLILDPATGQIIYDNPNADPEVEKNLSAIIATVAELQAYADADYEFRNKTYLGQEDGRTDLQREPLWWLKHQSWDWKKVRDNRNNWFAFMRKNTTMSEAELDILYNKISNNEDATAFSLIEGVTFNPAGNKNDPDDLSMKDGYEQFANTDILANMAANTQQLSKYVAYTEYFGEGGKYLEQLINEMEAEGKLTQEEIDNIVVGVKDIIDAATGNYNPLQNKSLAKFQRIAAFYSATVGLPFAAISSFPEFAMILFQGRGGNDTKNAINSLTGEFIDLFKGIADSKQNKILSQIPNSPIDRNGQQRLTESGHFNDDAAIATRLGLGETDVSMAWWQKQFYKFTGIAGITQLQRAIAASAVAGFVNDRMKILAAKPDNADFNQDQLEVYIQLRNLGMDVDKMIELHKRYNDPQMFDLLMDADQATEADNDFINQQMETVTWYFVNDRVQNPQAFNRPLFYQDPHFQLFVQFNGFISTFTANVIPRLYQDYLKNGSPTMKYNTFAMMIVMMGMAGASQWLKDYIKFGTSTPYLSNEQLVQRALMSSGLLGTGERVLQMGLPLYKSRDESLIDRFFGETIGAAPGIRNVISAQKAVDALSSGDTERAAGQAAKLIPFLGPFTGGRNALTDLVHGRIPTAESAFPYANRENE